jgi:hypothetical protein
VSDSKKKSTLSGELKGDVSATGMALFFSDRNRRRVITLSMILRLTSGFSSTAASSSSKMLSFE